MNFFFLLFFLTIVTNTLGDMGVAGCIMALSVLLMKICKQEKYCVYYILNAHEYDDDDDVGDELSTSFS